MRAISSSGQQGHADIGGRRGGDAVEKRDGHDVPDLSHRLGRVRLA